jgi:hypothetical protein
MRILFILLLAFMLAAGPARRCAAEAPAPPEGPKSAGTAVALGITGLAVPVMIMAKGGSENGAAAVAFESGNSSGGEFMATCGAAIFLVSSVADIVAAAEAVDEHNRSLRKPEPTVYPVISTRQSAFGVALILRM